MKSSLGTRKSSRKRKADVIYEEQTESETSYYTSSEEDDEDEDDGEDFDFEPLGQEGMHFAYGMLGASMGQGTAKIPKKNGTLKKQKNKVVIYLDNDDDEYVDKSKQVEKSSRKPRKAPVSPYRAEVKELATDDASHTSADHLAHLDQTMLSRIKKALALGKHPGTGEAEAKAALRMAAQLMNKLSIKEADVIASETIEEKSQRAGCSKVAILHVNRGKVPCQAWVVRCAQAMTTWFDVKCFSTSYASRFEWTFYGIAENTVAAALAMEMVHNLILEWGRITEEARGNRNSYYLGISEQLCKMARADKMKEAREAEEAERIALKERMEKEEKERAAELERLRDVIEEETEGKVQVERVKIEEEEDVKWSVAACGTEDQKGDEQASDDNDDDNFGINSELVADFDDREEMLEIDLIAELARAEQNLIEKQRKEEEEKRAREKRWKEQGLEEKKKRVEKGKVKVEEDDDIKWKNSQQLTIFREASKAIAEAWEKRHNLKLKKRRKRKESKINYKAYSKGRDDAKKIDVKRRRIEA